MMMDNHKPTSGHTKKPPEPSLNEECMCVTMPHMVAFPDYVQFVANGYLFRAFLLIRLRTIKRLTCMILAEIIPAIFLTSSQFACIVDEVVQKCSTAAFKQQILFIMKVVDRLYTTTNRTGGALLLLILAVVVVSSSASSASSRTTTTTTSATTAGVGAAADHGAGGVRGTTTRKENEREGILPSNVRVLQAAPSNDNICNASDLSTGGGVFTNVGATIEDGEPLYGPYSVWFYVQPTTECLNIVFDEDRYDLLTALYEVSSLPGCSSPYDAFPIFTYGCPFQPLTGITVSKNKVYMIQVSSYSYSNVDVQAGDFTIQYNDDVNKCTPAPANDNVCNAVEITPGEIPNEFNNYGATIAEEEPTFNVGQYSVWFYVTATSECLSIFFDDPNTDEGTNDLAAAIYEVSSLPEPDGDGSCPTSSYGDLFLLAQNDNGFSGAQNSFPQLTGITVTTNKIYMIQVTSNTCNDPGDFNIQYIADIGKCEAPLNDNVCKAKELLPGGGADVLFTNVGATIEEGEPFNGAFSVWFYVQPTSECLNIVFDEDRSDLSTALYEVSSLSGCSSPYKPFPTSTSGCPFQPLTGITVSTDKVYMIQVSSYYYSNDVPAGDFTIQYNDDVNKCTPAPANDNVCSAVEITPGETPKEFNNVGATIQDKEPNDSDSFGYNSVWFYVAPTTECLTIVLDDPNPEEGTSALSATIYEVSSLPKLDDSCPKSFEDFVFVARTQSFSSFPQFIGIPVATNKIYMIQVTSQSCNDSGDFTIQYITDVDLCQAPLNDNVCNAAELLPGDVIAFDNFGATIEGEKEPNVIGSWTSSVWFYVTPTSQCLNVVFDDKTFLGNNDLTAALFEVPSLPEGGGSCKKIPYKDFKKFVLRASNDDGYSEGVPKLPQLIGIPVSTEKVYMIQVDSYSFESPRGDFTIQYIADRENCESCQVGLYDGCKDKGKTAVCLQKGDGHYLSICKPDDQVRTASIGDIFPGTDFPMLACHNCLCTFETDIEEGYVVHEVHKSFKDDKSLEKDFKRDPDFDFCEPKPIPPKKAKKGTKGTSGRRLSKN